MLRTLFSALVLFACTAFGQPTYTQITDTIYTPVGGVLFNGTLQISNPVLVGTAGNTIGQWAYTTQIVNGAVSLRLVPTDTSSPPGTQYVFRFTPQLNNGSAYIEYCNVPTTNSTVTLSQICATGSGATVNLNQITQSLATVGQIPQWNGTHWVPANGGGGSLSFSSLTGGTNTSAAMIVGSGASMSVSGSGTIAATTAAALAASPSNCSSGSYPTGINTGGAAQNCTPVTTTAGGTTVGGDASGTVANIKVVGINGTNLAGLVTGLLKNTTATGVPVIAVAGTDYLTPTGNGSGLTSLTPANISAGTAAINISGNAATATALAALPTPCSSGSAPTGILANGNSTGCSAYLSATLPSPSGTFLYNNGGALATGPMTTDGTNTFTNAGLSLGASSLTAGDLFDVTTPYTAATLPGTVSVSGTAVTGSGTSFLETYTAGDTITVVTTSGTETQTIASVPSDTAMTTSAFAGTASGVTYIGNDPVGGNLRWRVLQNGQLVAGNSGSAINLRQLLYAAPVYTNPASNVSVRVLNVAPVLNVTSAPFSGNYISANFNTEIGAANTQNLTGTGVGLAGARGEVTATAGSSGVVSLASGVIGHLLFPSGAATLTTGYLFQGSVTATGITNLAGIAIPDLTGATRSTAVLIGTTIIPTGQNWGIYDGSSLTSFINQLQLNNISASSPVVATDGSKNLIAGTTTGSGSTLMLNNSPTLAPSANTTALTYSGYSLTGSNTQALVTGTGTWNTSGSPTLDFFNLTDTASGTGSLFFLRQVGGVNKFAIRKDGQSFPNVGLKGSVVSSAFTTATAGINGLGGNNSSVCNRVGYFPVSGYLRTPTITTGTTNTGVSMRANADIDCAYVTGALGNGPTPGGAFVAPLATANAYADAFAGDFWHESLGALMGIGWANQTGGSTAATVNAVAMEFVGDAANYPSLLVADPVHALAASTTAYEGFYSSSGVGSGKTSDLLAAIPMPFAGTIGGSSANPFVVCLSVSPVNTQTFTLRVNGASPVSGPAVSSGAGDASGQCYMDNTHSATVAAGDYVNVQSVTGASTVSTVISMSTSLVPTSGTTTFMGGQIGTTVSTTVNYWLPLSPQSSTTVALGFLLPIQLGRISMWSRQWRTPEVLRPPALYTKTVRPRQSLEP